MSRLTTGQASGHGCTFDGGKWHKWSIWLRRVKHAVTRKYTWTFKYANAPDRVVTSNHKWKHVIMVPDGRGTIARTDDDFLADLLNQGLYIREDGEVACFTCGGNCGQCGSTGRLGNIGLSFERVVRGCQDRTRGEGDSIAQS